MVARRHMHEFGTTPEQLAEIAVGVREYATLNPNALYREPISVEDVLGSRMIADPLRKLDCCVISDGGGALVLTTRERARDLGEESERDGLIRVPSGKQSFLGIPFELGPEGVSAKSWLRISRSSGASAARQTQSVQVSRIGVSIRPRSRRVSA